MQTVNIESFKKYLEILALEHTIEVKQGLYTGLTAYYFLDPNLTESQKFSFTESGRVNGLFFVRLGVKDYYNDQITKGFFN